MNLDQLFHEKLAGPPVATPPPAGALASFQAFQTTAAVPSFWSFASVASRAAVILSCIGLASLVYVAPLKDSYSVLGTPSLQVVTGTDATDNDERNNSKLELTPPAATTSKETTTPASIATTKNPKTETPNPTLSALPAEGVVLGTIAPSSQSPALPADRPELTSPAATTANGSKRPLESEAIRGQKWSEATARERSDSGLKSRNSQLATENSQLITQNSKPSPIPTIPFSNEPSTATATLADRPTFEPTDLWPKRSRLGIIAGGSAFVPVTNTPQTTVSWGAGPLLGVRGSYILNPVVSLNAEALYQSRNGMAIEQAVNPTIRGLSFVGVNRLHYLSIPVYFNVRYDRHSLNLGLQFNQYLTASLKTRTISPVDETETITVSTGIPSNINRNDLSGMAGYSYVLTEKFDIGLRWQPGLFGSIATQRNTAFSFTLDYKILR